MSQKKISILGTRGIPANHGGFETFAEHLALFLVADGWDVTVYCQSKDKKTPITVDEWSGVRRVHIGAAGGAFGTIQFDYRCVFHMLAGDPGLVLTLGYNTAFLSAFVRAKGIPNITNMDGIEWKRKKWAPHERAWLWINERFGCWFSNHLVADHPVISEHLEHIVSKKKITTIAYGGDEVLSADNAVCAELGVEPGRFATVIARPEPENSILEIVHAFSSKKRSHKLVLLGKYDRSNAYHSEVLAAAGQDVIFAGAIYDKAKLAGLRLNSCLYVHGHQVGGTNPSLVEALGAGSPVLAHDNRFNRWVAGPGARYFTDESECAMHFDEIMGDESVVAKMRAASRKRFLEGFTWNHILNEYLVLLDKWKPKNVR